MAEGKISNSCTDAINRVSPNSCTDAINRVSTKLWPQRRVLRPTQVQEICVFICLKEPP
ncbi:MULTISPECIES: hypothetical protein [Nostoc]|uniref:Uncharacterized protein n=2 Tax=Nostoc TaxID=1177 RepID=A0ABR8ID39_9NOSO|nr:MULTISPECIES: hypothetical protein [Nostoc]MBD2562738.1 hypothetical protein [Nostoc linckia FACHB-391]MBD2648360.1 hypothetical protein [Nostoc foliaceum FACHB-393]